MKKLVVVGGLWAVGALAALSWPRDPYTRFAAAYNDVVTDRRGVLDLVKIHKMQKAWRALNRAAGWPDDEKPCVFEVDPADLTHVTLDGLPIAH